MTLKVLLFVVLSFSIAVGQALACGCGGVPQDPPQNSAELVRRVLDKAEYIFLGKVTGFNYRNDVVSESLEQARRDRPLVGFEVKFAEVRVERWWKGALTGEVEIITEEIRGSNGSTRSNSCDFHFKEGETYLIFAKMVGGQLKTGACSGTAPVSALKDIGLLGEGNPPISSKTDLPLNVLPKSSVYFEDQVGAVGFGGGLEAGFVIAG